MWLTWILSGIVAGILGAATPAAASAGSEENSHHAKREDPDRLGIELVLSGWLELMRKHLEMLANPNSDTSTRM